MTGRPKTGGRKRGTPNRRMADVEKKLAALGCDPLAGMAAIATDPVGVHWTWDTYAVAASAAKAIVLPGRR